MGISFLAIYRSFFVQFRLLEDPWIQENDIYQMSIKNHSFHVFFNFLYFGAKKWAWPPGWRQRVWGPKSHPKSLLIGWLLQLACYLEIEFSHFLGRDPLPLKFICIINYELKIYLQLYTLWIQSFISYEFKISPPGPRTIVKLPLLQLLPNRYPRTII